MKISLLSLVIILLYLDLDAQPTQRDLLQKFSKVEVGNALISRDKWKPFPKTPEEWQLILPQKEIDQIIAIGDSVLKQDFKSLPATAMLEYLRTKDRVNYENQSFAKRSQLWSLVLAESVQGKGRYSDKIADGVWSICEESFWGVPAHLSNQKAGLGLADVENPIVDLFAAETASVLAWTDYFAGGELDKVSKLLRPRIKYEVDRRVLAPIMVAKYNWLIKPNPNNWIPWIMSNCIVSSLLLEDNNQKRTDLVFLAMKNIDKYINYLGDDGAIDEGPSYWFAAVGCVFDALDLLNDATAGRINIYKDPFIGKMASYIYKTHIGDTYFISVADAEPKLIPDGLALFRFGSSIEDKKLMAFGSWAYHRFGNDGNAIKGNFRSRRLFNMLAEKKCDAYIDEFPVIGDVWLPSIQLMSAKAKGLFVAAHGGHNAESHNHNDVGDFIVYADNYPVLIDVGCGTYTARTFSSNRYNLWFNTSAYHNLPTINGAQQLPGNDAKATDVTYKSTNKAVVLSMNIGKAYPDSVVNSWVRTINLSRNGTLNISDEYTLPSLSKEMEQTFMTVCPVNIETPGIITFAMPNQKFVTLTYNASVWTIKKEKLMLNLQEDNRIKRNWESSDIWKISLIGKNIKQSGTFNYQIRKGI